MTLLRVGADRPRRVWNPGAVRSARGGRPVDDLPPGVPVDPDHRTTRNPFPAPSPCLADEATGGDAIACRESNGQHFPGRRLIGHSGTGAGDQAGPLAAPFLLR